MNNQKLVKFTTCKLGNTTTRQPDNLIIITAPVHEIFTETLSNKGIPFLYQPGILSEEIKPLLNQATGIVVSTHLEVNKSLIDLAPHLQWIGRLGSGMEHIDVAYAKSKNINCISSPEGNRNAVAELALGSLLCLLRNIHSSFDEVKHFQWNRDKNRGTELSGRTIGIVGYGNTGMAFAKLLQAFDVTLLVYDKYRTNINEYGAIPTELTEIAERADVISFHLPWNIETQHFANSSFFNSLKKSPILINTSRGSIVNTASLIEALTHKKVSGAVLDVLENEKLNQLSPTEQLELELLIQHPNTIITPHIGGYSFEATYKMSAVLLEKLGLL